jgi:hypothetical protein
MVIGAVLCLAGSIGRMFSNHESEKMQGPPVEEQK